MPFLVAHTTLLEISCRGSNNIALKDAIVGAWAAVTGIRGPGPEITLPPKS